MSLGRFRGLVIGTGVSKGVGPTFAERVVLAIGPRCCESAASFYLNHLFTVFYDGKRIRCERSGPREGGHPAFAHGELFPTPVDLVGGETGQPEDEMDGVPEWDQPELLADGFVPGDADANHPGGDQAEDQ